MAVQELQVAEPTRPVQERVGNLCGVERRGCAEYGQRLGERRGECAGGEVESDSGGAGAVEGQGGCGGDMGSGGGEYAE